MAWIAPVVAAVVSAAGTAITASQQAASRRAQRNASALASQGSGATPGNYQPTALQAKAASPLGDVDKTGLVDLLNRQQPNAQFNELPSQGFSPDAKPDPAQGSVGSKESDSHMLGDTSKDFGTKDYINTASSLANIAQGLMQRPQAQGAPIPQPGPMNYQPTALSILAARRNPYGGGYV